MNKQKNDEKLHDVTLCLTIGKRPKELHETLTSLLSYLKFKEIIAINDFGDDETNEVFLSLCPKGRLINLGYNLGHHKAVDEMYQHVTTQYVFHCEDDWLFDSKPDISAAKTLLTHPNISSVSFRKLSDFYFYEENKADIITETYKDIQFDRINHFHSQWFGYSFNPHLIDIDLWKDNSGFAMFVKERHISRWQRKKSKFMAFAKPGNCYHIGDEKSVSHITKPASKFKLLRKKLKKMLGISKI